MTMGAAALLAAANLDHLPGHLLDLPQDQLQAEVPSTVQLALTSTLIMEPPSLHQVAGTSKVVGELAPKHLTTLLVVSWSSTWTYQMLMEA